MGLVSDTCMPFCVCHCPNDFLTITPHLFCLVTKVSQQTLALWVNSGQRTIYNTVSEQVNLELWRAGIAEHSDYLVNQKRQVCHLSTAVADVSKWPAWSTTLPVYTWLS